LATAESKAGQIEDYFLARKRDVTTLSHTPTLIDAMERFDTVFEKGGLDSLEYGEVDRQVRPFLTYYRELAGFADLFLISPKGDAVFSVNRGEDLGSNYKTGYYKDSELAKVFDRASTLLETEVSDFGYYPATNEPAAFIASPIIKEGAVIGVVALQLSNKEVYQLVLDYTGLGQTGETIIGSAVQNKAVFVTPVRHDPHAAFRRSVTIGSVLDIPLQEAAQAKKRHGITVDYRGKPVLAAWRYLPSPRWGMVIKIDTDEAFAPIHNLKNVSLIISLIVVILVIIAALLISKSFSDPIVKLTRATGLIAAGDLTHRANIQSTDEIGELAMSFNTMAVNIEERVAERTAELSAANRELEAFTYTVSHDLRAPVRALLGFSTLLVKEHADSFNADGRRLLSVLQEESSRIGNLIDDLLDFSRLGHSELKRFHIDMNILVRTVVDQLRALEPQRSLTVSILDLPPLIGDPALLRQVFINLIGNAFKYTGKNQETAVTIGAQLDPKECIYFVADNGVGFDMRYAAKLFRVFERLHTTSEFPGNGVGLAIVQRIIQRHGGRVWAESKLGAGATFYVALPK
ncbi:MAG: HAMP domain-containing protein, partial [Nitrospirae bacterium]|nr:HAMP domain-containing protein [Candidatus Troglogloeales bacterium]